MLWWVQVQADDVGDLGLEVGVVGRRVALEAMGLEMGSLLDSGLAILPLRATRDSELLKVKWARLSARRRRVVGVVGERFREPAVTGDCYAANRLRARPISRSSKILHFRLPAPSAGQAARPSLISRMLGCRPSRVRSQSTVARSSIPKGDSNP